MKTNRKLFERVFKTISSLDANARYSSVAIDRSLLTKALAHLDLVCDLIDIAEEQQYQQLNTEVKKE